MSSSASKKPKTTTNDEAYFDQFDRVKNYLLECPHVSAEHPAIKAAIEGLEKERKRRERDLKLQLKFATTTTAATDGGSLSAPSSSTTTITTMGDDLVVIDANVVVLGITNGGVSSGSTAENHDDPDELMEWQDVPAATKTRDELNGEVDDDDEAGSLSFLGERLSKIAIDAISEHSVKVKSPVAAIAVALHAALRSDLLGFDCTGIPEEPKKGGFAAPIRALPKNQFLPLNWDTTTTTTKNNGTKSTAPPPTTCCHNNKVALRYRKNGTGALILTVEEEEKLTTSADHGKIVVQVRLSPTSSQEPDSQFLSFTLDEHVNLDSWQAALKVSPTTTTTTMIAPALHYKGLIMLLTKFCRTFDLGSIADEQEHPKAAASSLTSATTLPYVDNTIVQRQTSSSSTFIRKSDFVSPEYPPIPVAGYRVPSTIDQAFPSLHHPYGMPRGDFSGDIAPGGLMDPRLGPGFDGRMGGNLMGPNHPMFAGRGGFDPAASGLPVGGPGTMQPRFDPIHPGVVYDPDGRGLQPPGPGRRRLGGEPNPDHLPPPNAFGNDMFS